MRYRSIFILCILVMLLTSCKEGQSEKRTRIADLYRPVYERAYAEHTLDSLDTMEELVDCLGEAGYVAVDVNNQLDLVHPEKVDAFCRKVEKKEKGKLAIYMVREDGGLVRYKFKTAGGTVDIESSSLNWKGKDAAWKQEEKFQAYAWNYTEGGYLFFEQYRPPGYDGESGHTAVRVRGLDLKCREYNRKYVLPVGYGSNNLLLTDWSETDYGNLNFYDMYEKLYPVKYQENIPYESDFTGKEYDIPKEEFESVIDSYFQIDNDVLREKTVYHDETETYRYRPRGMYDSECPLEPYPEVTAYEELPDGAIRLTVNGVWEWENREDVISSELVVRPLSDGSFRYISNRVIRNVVEAESLWYTERLTDEQWEMYYGDEQ